MFSGAVFHLVSAHFSFSGPFPLLFSAGWGQGGYIALAYGENTCGMADFPMFVQAA
jgi:hypothetical protein